MLHSDVGVSFFPHFAKASLDLSVLDMHLAVLLIPFVFLFAVLLIPLYILVCLMYSGRRSG